MKQLGKLFESIGQLLGSLIGVFKEIGEGLIELADTNIQVYRISLKVIGGFFVQVWNARRPLLMIMLFTHIAAFALVGLGLNFGNEGWVTTGGFLLLLFYVIFFGFFELMGASVKTVASVAEGNTVLWDRVIRALVPGGSTGEEMTTEKFLNLSGIKQAMNQVKQIRMLIIPLLIACLFLIVNPSWWTAKVAFNVLLVSYLLAWFANTQDYDMSKATRRTFNMIGWLIPVIIFVMIFPASREYIGNRVDDVNAWFSDNGLQYLDETLPIVYLTPIDTVAVLVDSTATVDTIMTPGEKFALIGVTESDFRTGKLPDNQLIPAPNGLQILMKIHRPNGGGVLEFHNEALLAQAGKYELWSKYQEHAEKTKPEPEKKSDEEPEEVLQEKQGETGQVALSTDVGEVKWVNPKEAIITVYPSKTFPTMIYLAQDTEFYYYASGSGCEYVSSSVGRQPISESGTILYAYDPKTHLVVSNSSNQTQQIRLVIVKGGTINS